MGQKKWMGSDGKERKESLQPADDKGKRKEDGRSIGVPSLPRRRERRGIANAVKEDREETKEFEGKERAKRRNGTKLC